jgi:hypothetical protein
LQQQSCYSRVDPEKRERTSRAVKIQSKAEEQSKAERLREAKSLLIQDIVAILPTAADRPRAITTRTVK